MGHRASWVMNLEEEGREREQQTGLRNVPWDPTSCWWPGAGAWTEAPPVAGQAGGPGGLGWGCWGLLKLLPIREAGGGAGLPYPQGRPQLLPLPSTNNLELKTAQAKQQKQAGQVLPLPSTAGQP